MINHLNQLSDNELVHNYKIEDCQRSIALLYKRHKDRIYTTIYMMVKDRYLAEDLMQEVLIKAACNIKKGKYTEQGKFISWICRIAHNLCIDYIRKTKSSTYISTVAEENFEWDRLRKPMENAEDVIVKTEKERQLHQLIDQLPKEQMEVVMLRIYGELSFKEISEMMQVSVNTSLGRMRYGLQNLKKMINQQQVAIR